MFTQDLQDQYVNVGTVNTRFWALGDEGPAVILLHGLGASVESWAHNMEPLAREHRVWALDLAGFGLSEKPAVSYTLSYFAQFVVEFMRTRGIERASLIGHSLGGGVALKLTLEHPEMVDKLVLVSSAGLGREGHILFRLASVPVIGKLVTRPSRRGTAMFLKECFYDSAMVTDGLIELNYALASKPGAQKAYLSTARSIANLFGGRKKVINSIVSNLNRITAPTLIVWGAQDKMLPPAHGHVAEERIPDAQIRVFDRCGHVPPVEKTEAFNSLVSRFLSR